MAKVKMVACEPVVLQFLFDCSFFLLHFILLERVNHMEALKRLKGNSARREPIPM